MRRIATAAALVSLCTGFGIVSGHAADLTWEVENPFRFFKSPHSFAMQERAFDAVRGDPQSPMPHDIVSRLERRLNHPDCRDPSSPNACAATQRAHYEQSRLGWAAQTLPSICYESNGHPRRYPTVCDRRYSWGSAREDYVLPQAHTVTLSLSPQLVAAAGDGECQWSWVPRAPGGKTETRSQACKRPLTIPRVPYSQIASASGVSVTVKLPDGRELSEPDVMVEDLFIVALGDSFASGESNPDRPVVFSGVREMVYDPVNQREEMATRSVKPPQPGGFGLASNLDQFDPKSLPKRRLADEEQSRIYKPTSREFLAAFEQRSAQWVSRDCHRSQYGYPFRVGIELALENRHRAVTLVSLACSGAAVTEGLFGELAAREGGEKVAAQFDQLSDLICRGGASGRTRSAQYALPFVHYGSAGVQMRSVAKRWCPPDHRKRPIDLVLLSIGGNDVGFGGLAVYSITESASDIAPVAALAGSEIRYSPAVSRGYLSVLDRRMKAVKDALSDGFGVDPSRVVQTAYEPIQYDETGGLCGSIPTLGMDVHPKLRLSRERLRETADFLRDFLARLDCISSTRRRPDCPANLATGTGTGFNLVTEHQSAFLKRGVCARDPKRLTADGAAMAMPRKSRATDEFVPYSPAYTLPYGHRWRLFHTPNDAFLTANVHKEGISPFDILQPAYAALWSGAIHPTAEAHAIVADHVMPHVRAILDRRDVVQR